MNRIGYKARIKIEQDRKKKKQNSHYKKKTEMWRNIPSQLGCNFQFCIKIVIEYFDR